MGEAKIENVLGALTAAGATERDSRGGETLQAGPRVRSREVGTAWIGGDVELVHGDKVNVEKR
jgi:hypothetical protein